ncbi:Heat shock factor protein 4 [Mayamaea pseudoterrestris]|nr:Heat shock factor protein 4 [Mayamaea pseudoterrestris]
MASIDVDVPIFLRKLYAMVNEVDDTICEWHSDGRSFVIKDQKAFEKSVIPQFFKHSKIASFVRQLNFYSFRKVPHNESLRIDPEVEKKTKDWWRFRHDQFQRHHPELLRHIKRTPNPSNKVTTSSSSQLARSPSPVASHTKAAPEVTSEVIQLKKKIAEMTKNIDELTTLVQKVSLKQEENDKVGNKRLKPGVDDPKGKEDTVRPDAMMSNADVDEVVGLEPVESMMMGVAPDFAFSIPDPVALASTSPVSSIETDNEFVDSLFDVFAQDPDVELLDEVVATKGNGSYANHPDPELMRRLGDALMLLPKEIQEMIVDRLIAAIMNTDIATNKKAVAAVEEEVHKFEEVVPVTEDYEEENEQQFDASDRRRENSLPLAAATLAALLHHYSTEFAAKSHQKHTRIPVIPVHG